MLAKHYQLGEYILYCAGADELLFTENETNSQRLFGVAGAVAVREGCVSRVRSSSGKQAAINPAQSGTKAAARYDRTVAAGQTVTLQLRLSALVDDHPLEAPFADFDAIISQRREEADAFYRRFTATDFRRMPN